MRRVGSSLSSGILDGGDRTAVEAGTIDEAGTVDKAGIVDEAGTFNETLSSGEMNKDAEDIVHHPKMIAKSPIRSDVESWLGVDWEGQGSVCCLLLFRDGEEFGSCN